MEESDYKHRWSLQRYWKQSPSFRAAIKSGIIMGFLFFILGLLLSPIVTPQIDYFLLPSKEITVYSGDMQIFNKTQIIRALTYPTVFRDLRLIQGCGFRYLSYLYDVRGDWKQGDELLFGGMNSEGICAGCILYPIEIQNIRNEDATNIRVDVSLFDDKAEIIKSDPSIRVEKQMGSLGKGGFILEIDKLKSDGNQPRIILRSDQYNNLSFDCSSVPKQKCKIVKYSTAFVYEKDAVEEVNRKYGYSFPFPKEDEIEIFYFNFIYRKFFKVKLGISGNKIVVDGGKCKTENPNKNPISIFN